jgi:hypothetical protein
MSASRSKSKSQSHDTISWLLDGDPAIRWQTLRDLTGANERTFERERKKIAREGCSKRELGTMLSLQVAR